MHVHMHVAWGTAELPSQSPSLAGHTLGSGEDDPRFAQPHGQEARKYSETSRKYSHACMGISLCMAYNPFFQQFPAMRVNIHISFSSLCRLCV